MTPLHPISDKVPQSLHLHLPFLPWVLSQQFFAPSGFFAPLPNPCSGGSVLFSVRAMCLLSGPRRCCRRVRGFCSTGRRETKALWVSDLKANQTVYIVKTSAGNFLYLFLLKKFLYFLFWEYTKVFYFLTFIRCQLPGKGRKLIIPPL